jgi:hypothetical protein
MNHFYSRTTIDGSAPGYVIPCRLRPTCLGRDTHVTPSFSMPNPSSASYTVGYNGRTYANTNGNYQASYTTVAYTDPIPLPYGSVARWSNYTNNNTIWYTTYDPPDHDGYCYGTHCNFFRPRPVEMMPARATTQLCADPNNLTTQLTTILREAFGIEPKGRGVYIKNLTPITTTNSLTLEDTEFPSSENLLGRMVKPHFSILTNLFTM